MLETHVNRVLGLKQLGIDNFFVSRDRKTGGLSLVAYKIK